MKWVLPINIDYWIDHDFRPWIVYTCTAFNLKLSHSPSTKAQLKVCIDLLHMHETMKDKHAEPGHGCMSQLLLSVAAIYRDLQKNSTRFDTLHLSEKESHSKGKFVFVCMCAVGDDNHPIAREWASYICSIQHICTRSLVYLYYPPLASNQSYLWTACQNGLCWCYTYKCWHCVLTM